ncbi:hypothetical protein [Pseudomonas sp. 5P_5.1_Bac1]|uniref:hypothetical protein n=1 Tax=Pseudomonas sp. 5P_5.1_Bac1 TaxID=2971616 RepID=UPI0021CA6DBA|nr:hypothetical protein [Pseudomonas sp. 5P_5.1_Bac1]MCU1721765.1 hypothetical protein [Pseudomonas sp. 5P_5.1_Bac1]
MKPSSTSATSAFSASLGSKSTVKSKGRPLIRIIHLDCGAGGDCTVLFTDSQFIVIDGGKVETGTRLSTLLTELMEQEIMPLAFIVSHFDTDHYLGLFHAIKTICMDCTGVEEDDEDEDEHEDPFETIEIITPARAKVLNKDMYGKPTNREEASSVAVACRQLKNAVEAVRKTRINYNNANTLTFDNGFSLVLQNNPAPLNPSLCNGNNGSSLQWILVDSKGRTKTTYYTGGDAEAGPLDATIVKLDHHGSTVGHTNSKASKLKSTLYWVIMGAGRGHKHPGQNLLPHANKASSNIVMTQHHFIDVYHKHKLVFVSRTPPHWGDNGFSIFAGDKILVNIDNSRGLLTIGGKHTEIDNEYCANLDEDMEFFLDVTRNILNCPAEKPCDRDTVPEPPPLQCLHAGCNNEATEMSLNPESTTFIACEEHGAEELERQQTAYFAKRTREEQAELKRERTLKKHEDEDEDFEENSEEDDEDNYEEDDDELAQESKVHKKIKTK